MQIIQHSNAGSQILGINTRRQAYPKARPEASHKVKALAFDRSSEGGRHRYLVRCVSDTFLCRRLAREGNVIELLLSNDITTPMKPSWN